MRLFLMRHGDAFEATVNPKRFLSERGKEQVRKTAEFLRSIHPQIDAIFSSTKTRAIETALILKEILEIKQDVQQKQRLLPNDPVEALLHEIANEDRNLLIVGHLPHLSLLVSQLLTGEEHVSLISLPTASIICLERKSSGLWQIVFSVTPDILLRNSKKK